MQTKIIELGGMTCPHCHERVANALNQLPGVTAKVNPGAKFAQVETSDDVTNSLLMKAILDAGYQVLSIKKG